MDVSNIDGNNVVAGKAGDAREMDSFKLSVDELLMKVDNLEQRVKDVEQTLNNTMSFPSTSATKDKDKERPAPSFKKLQQDASRREAAAAKRMQDLMRQFGSILRQITQHKCAWPFMQPVDVEGLGLDDYYEVIDRPMDFSTIKNQMEAKDGTGYRHVRDICADVRLIFQNAMNYNEEKSNVYKMAKTLLGKFEEKWLQLLPKVNEEEKRREDEEAEAQSNMRLAQQAVHAKTARDLSNELYEVDSQLEELRGIIVKKCRKLSVEEKRNIGIALSKLAPEDLSKALNIVAQDNSNFHLTDEDLDLDIDAQSESTLWRLKFFLKDVLSTQDTGSRRADDINANNKNATTNPKNNAMSKRKKEISDTVAKTAKKRLSMKLERDVASPVHINVGSTTPRSIKGLMEDPNRNLKQNPDANELPEADSLPDGFVESSSPDQLVSETAKPQEEEDPDENDYKEEKLVDPSLRPRSVVAEECQSSEKTNTEVLGPQVEDVKEISSLGNTENNKKAEAPEGKRKNAKRTFKTEKEFLEFTLKYQQVLAERDSAIAVRDKLESLCRELQRQNKILMDECKRVSTEGQNLRLDLSNKFQDAIKEVSVKLDEQKDECLSQLKENEMLRHKLKELADQYALSEQQHAQKLKQKNLELQIADLKLKQHEEKLIQEQSQMKLYAEQVSQLLATEKNLRLQLTADGEKFQQFQEALLKSNEVFETFKQEIEKMAKSLKELKKENTFLKGKCEKSDISLIELVEEREHLKKQLERTRNQKEKLEALCRSLQAERKANSTAVSSTDTVAV
ncbi:OLC1v1026015C2 [Oldenlandia corymbosa var. corymbosa]|uniref:OLC1v1026015C2 n=1 Tax=Oldenlandia corymbosa var. corymbosa TaxID=529605 RepID=A0AAV1C7W0_OLDCO|nr:OLC1v1026015C2 [Oldenlandia corymbosa var. corymbosa]